MAGQPDNVDVHLTASWRPFCTNVAPDQYIADQHSSGWTQRKRSRGELARAEDRACARIDFCKPHRFRAPLPTGFRSRNIFSTVYGGFGSDSAGGSSTGSGGGSSVGVVGAGGVFGRGGGIIGSGGVGGTSISAHTDPCPLWCTQLSSSLILTSPDLSNRYKYEPRKTSR